MFTQFGIQRDCIVISGDLLSEVNLDEIIDAHVLSDASVTVLLHEDRIEPPQPVAPGGKKPASKPTTNTVDDDDYNVYAVDEGQRRILQIMDLTDLEDKGGFQIKRSIVARNPNLTLRSNFKDTHLYVCKKSTIDYLRQSHHDFKSIQTDLLTFILRNQYNSKLLEEWNDLIEKPEMDLVKKMSSTNKPTNPISIHYYADSTSYCKRVSNIKDYMQANIDCVAKPNPCLVATANNDRPLVLTPPKEEETKKDVGEVAALQPQAAVASLEKKDDPKEDKKQKAVKEPKEKKADKEKEPKEAKPKEKSAKEGGETNETKEAKASRAPAEKGLKLEKAATTPAENTKPKEAGAKKDKDKKQVQIKDCWIGEGTLVDDKVNIQRSIIAKNCKIGKNVKIVNCVIMRDVVIGDDVNLQSTFVGTKSVINAGSKIRDCQISHNSVVKENSQITEEIIVPESEEQIQSLGHISISGVSQLE
eukprot:TRINITY_DN3734_c0_g1_i3.p1 TRINITY_DN3734_c0_g1~~TRINITY_DN3734_c0_g1_i3.p1  ORF type:complete len:474 (+),score=121.60 TRINITY_DN3734_c0_g1_i3:417-1838(+)